MLAVSDFGIRLIDMFQTIFLIWVEDNCMEIVLKAASETELGKRPGEDQCFFKFWKKVKKTLQKH